MAAEGTISVRFEMKTEPDREVMLHVSHDGNTSNVGWYRYDDSDNLVEIANILVHRLEKAGLRGDILLLYDDEKDKFPCELFQSDLGEAYRYGKVKLERIAA